MPLSARTVHDRTIMMANQVEETQVKDINAATYFSLVLDESTVLGVHVGLWSAGNTSVVLITIYCRQYRI